MIKLDNSFLRCHKSYAVNLKYAVDLLKYKIVMSDGTKVPVSRNYYDNVKKWFLSIKLQKSGCNGEIYLHTIFENQYYLPQQMWVYLYNILLTVVANSFVLHSKQSKIKTIYCSRCFFTYCLYPNTLIICRLGQCSCHCWQLSQAISCCIKTDFM